MRFNCFAREKPQRLIIERHQDAHVQELPGHEDVRTTMIYLHVMNQPGLAVKSPVNGMS